MAESEEDATRAFRDLVNMNAAALRRWLDTEESRSVGMTHEGEHEAVGHQSGRRILAILEGEEAEEAFLHKVVGYVRRHLAQRPDGEIEHTRWRYSLMNWGHDPMQDSDTQSEAHAAQDAAEQGDETAMQDTQQDDGATREEPAPRRRATRTRRAAPEADGAEAAPRKPRARRAAA
ncbi:DUF3140 domain-containing protein, partial [Dankookia rubra]